MHMSFTGERYVPELRGQIYYEHFHRYAMVLELARDKDILDIACGEGYGTAALALVARTAVGVDLDRDSVRHASARYMAMNVGFRAGDCTQIPAADGSFDLAVSFETIEHLTEQERMLGELKRVLRPNGLLVISSPNKLVYSDGRSVQNPFHQRELYFDEFRDMLRSFFPKVRIFGQRVFAASAVHPLRGAADETRWLGPSTVAAGTLGALPDPEYFVAICGGAESSELPDLCSVYLDPRDELLADIRLGGLASARYGEQTALDAPPRASVLKSGEQHIGHEAEQRHAAVETELAKVECELAERVAQVKSLEAHAVGLESLLGTEQRRTSELTARLESLSTEVAHKREMSSLFETERQQENQSFAVRIAHLTQERDAALELETQRRQESQALAVRVADLNHERDVAIRLEAQRLQENQSLAARIVELEQAAREAAERRVLLERTLESRTHEHEELAAAVEGMHRKSLEMSDERVRIERRAAGVTLERDALRSALAEQQRRQADDLRLLEDALLIERERLGLELSAAREEYRQLRDRADELAEAAAKQEAERADLAAAIDRAHEDRANAEEARREGQRLIAQLKLERLNYDELAQRAHQAESLLQDVLGSTSWRLTLPARRLMGTIRGRTQR
jgi:ubiquinone/menaquinone biosynthesis C-methylase UbiE